MDKSGPQLLKHLPRMHKILDSISSKKKCSMEIQICNPSIQEVEEEDQIFSATLVTQLNSRPAWARQDPFFLQAKIKIGRSKVVSRNLKSGGGRQKRKLECCYENIQHSDSEDGRGDPESKLCVGKKSLIDIFRRESSLAGVSVSCLCCSWHLEFSLLLSLFQFVLKRFHLEKQTHALWFEAQHK